MTGIGGMQTVGHVLLLYGFHGRLHAGNLPQIQHRQRIMVCNSAEDIGVSIERLTVAG